MKSTKAIAVFAVLAFLSVTAPTKASVIAIGDTIQVGYVFPFLNGNHFLPLQNVLVGAGVELLAYPVGEDLNIDFSTDSIAIDYLGASTWSASEFNGPEITGLNNLSSVILNTNLAGLDLGDLTIADNMLRINWQGLDFNADSFVNITLVPEPASLMLFGTALAGIGTRAWRRRSAARR